MSIQISDFDNALAARDKLIDEQRRKIDDYKYNIMMHWTMFQPFLLYSVALVTGCLRLQTWVEFRAAGYLNLLCVSFIIS